MTDAGIQIGSGLLCCHRAGIQIGSGLLCCRRIVREPVEQRYIIPELLEPILLVKMIDYHDKLYLDLN